MGEISGVRDFYFSRDFLLGVDTVQEAERA